MLTKHEPAPACNHCNEEHVYVVNIMHVMMYVPRSQCSHCIITECMLIDVCFVMHVMQEPQGEQCYNTMQDHITRFCNTLHKYVCMFSN